MSKVSRMSKRFQMLSVVALAALVLWLALIPAASAASQEGWRLQVKRAAVVKGERVLLGEIIEPVGAVPRERMEALAQVQLWKGPRYQGRQQAVSRDQLAKLLKYYVPDLADVCVLPSRLVVQKGGMVLSRRQIEQQIVDYLTPRLATLGGEVDFRDFRIPNYIFLPDELGSIEVFSSGKVKPGPVSLTIRAKGGDGRISNRAAASLFADVWKAVPCAARPINRLSEVMPGKVTFMRKNLAYIGTPWDGTGGPYRMLRSVGTGQPLLLSSIEPVPMISKGEKVTLVYQGRTVRLSIKAEAMGDAELGDMVEVRNLQSKRIVLATVQDTATVVVR